MTFPSYSTGTVSVSANGTVVTGVGTIWSGVNARAGDVIIVDDLPAVEIKDVTDDTHLALWSPWSGGAKSAVSYTIIQKSPLRFAGGQAMADVSTLVAALNTDGFYVFVPSTATVPDPSYGNEGQYAFQATTKKLWVKEGGIWNFVGVFSAWGQTAPWDSGANYLPFDVATLNGSSYFCILEHTNHAPPNATYWRLIASKGDQGPAGADGTDGVTGPAAWTPPVAWITAAAYVAGPSASVVVQDGETYACLVPHTSGTFAIDLAAAKWIKVAQKGTDGAVASVGTDSTLQGGPITGSGTLALADAYRRNLQLDRIYQSKWLAGYRRFINALADGYKAVDGINAGASSNYTVDTSNGLVKPTIGPPTYSQIAQGTGTRIGDMTNVGGLAAAFDGVTSQAQTVGAASSGATSSGYLGKDWGAGNTHVVGKFVAYASTDAGFAGAGGTITLFLEGSNDGSGWTNLFTSPGFPTSAGLVKTFTSAEGINVSTAYRI
jgi:hypothetical protein